MTVQFGVFNMAAPQIYFTKDFNKVSPYQHISVEFFATMAYTEFQARATKEGESYGVGIGTLVAAFSNTPALTNRTFEIYDYDIVNGDGEYRISLFAKGEDGSWNDDVSFLVNNGDPLVTSDIEDFLVQK